MNHDEKYFFLFVGALFGTGLFWSGMADPQRVLGFLDVAGAWDPTLAFVMGGALLVTVPAFALARHRSTSLNGAPLELPRRWPVDARLVVGSVVFGLGWGLSGICPGPALMRVGYRDTGALLFVLALILGQFAAARVWRR